MNKECSLLLGSVNVGPLDTTCTLLDAVRGRKWVVMDDATSISLGN